MRRCRRSWCSGRCGCKEVCGVGGESHGGINSQLARLAGRSWYELEPAACSLQARAGSAQVDDTAVVLVIDGVRRAIKKHGGAGYRAARHRVLEESCDQ